jgi:hypothetical protein
MAIVDDLQFPDRSEAKILAEFSKFGNLPRRCSSQGLGPGPEDELPRRGRIPQPGVQPRDIQPLHYIRMFCRP